MARLNGNQAFKLSTGLCPFRHSPASFSHTFSSYGSKGSDQQPEVYIFLIVLTPRENIWPSPHSICTSSPHWCLSVLFGFMYLILYQSLCPEGYDISGWAYWQGLDVVGSYQLGKANSMLPSPLPHLGNVILVV